MARRFWNHTWSEKYKRDGVDDQDVGDVDVDVGDGDDQDDGDVNVDFNGVATWLDGFETTPENYKTKRDDGDEQDNGDGGVDCDATCLADFGTTPEKYKRDDGDVDVDVDVDCEATWFDSFGTTPDQDGDGDNVQDSNEEAMRIAERRRRRWVGWRWWLCESDDYVKVMNHHSWW